MNQLTERLADRWPLLTCLFIIAALFPLAKHYARHHPQEDPTNMPAAVRVRGYLRRRGRLWEYGLYAIDTGIRLRLGSRRSRTEAGTQIEAIVHPRPHTTPEDHTP